MDLYILNSRIDENSALVYLVLLYSHLWQLRVYIPAVSPADYSSRLYSLFPGYSIFRIAHMGGKLKLPDSPVRKMAISAAYRYEPKENADNADSANFRGFFSSA